MNDENPEITPQPPGSPNDAIQPGAPDFVETPDVLVSLSAGEKLPAWLFVVCGIALFLAGSSFTGLGNFGLGLYDQGPGAPVAVNKGQQASAEVEDPVSLGKKTYGRYCATCHQASGLGQAGKYPPLVDSEWVLGSKERLAAIILHGLAGPLSVKGASYGSEQMAPWSGAMNDKQMADLMTYIRASWGNKGDAVDAATVTAARAKFGSQSAAYNEGDLLKIAPHGADGGATK